jgi:SagB-type dehydrogenase family enzyme
MDGSDGKGGGKAPGVGGLFQKATAYVRGHLPGGMIDLSSQPKTHKEYPGAPRKILDPPRPRVQARLDAVLKKRRSVRHFVDSPLALEDLSFLLWAAAGVNRVERGMPFRTAPSAGALYPVETYFAARNVEGVPPGLYHYFPLAHAIEQLRKGDVSPDLSRAALDQRMPAIAPVTFVQTAVFARSVWKYKERAFRYIYLDCGHAAQNLALAAVSLGLGSCQIGALYDGEVNAVLGIDGEEESAVYMSAVGKP